MNVNMFVWVCKDWRAGLTLARAWASLIWACKASWCWPASCLSSSRVECSLLISDFTQAS